MADTKNRIHMTGEIPVVVAQNTEMMRDIEKNRIRAVELLNELGIQELTMPHSADVVFDSHSLERRICGQATDNAIYSAAELILKQYTDEPLIWNKFSSKTLDLKTPVRMGDLKNHYPELYLALTTPVGSTEQEKRDTPIDDESAIVQVGYWRNNDSDYSDLHFTIRGGSQDPERIRRILIKGGYYLGRAWEDSPNRGISESFVQDKDRDFKLIARAAIQSEQMLKESIANNEVLPEPDLGERKA